MAEPKKKKRKVVPIRPSAPIAITLPKKSATKLNNLVQMTIASEVVAKAAVEAHNAIVNQKNDLFGSICDTLGIDAMLEWDIDWNTRVMVPKIGVAQNPDDHEGEDEDDEADPE